MGMERDSRFDWENQTSFTSKLDSKERQKEQEKESHDASYQLMNVTSKSYKKSHYTFAAYQKN